MEPEEKLKSIISSINDLIFVLDKNLNFIDNFAGSDTLLFSDPKIFMGKNIREIMPKEFLDKALPILNNVLATRKPNELKYSLTIKNEIKHFLATISVRKDKDNEVIGLLFVVKDITKQENAEHALKESEKKYRTLFDNSKDALMTLQPPTWKFTSGNRAIVEMFGVKDEKEFTSLSPWQISPEYQPDGQLSVEKAKKMIEKAMKEGHNYFEWIHKKVNGDNFHATVLLSRIETGENSYLQATVRDISKRKKAQEALKESEEKFRMLADKSPNMIFINKRGKIVYANKKCEEMGYTQEEFLSDDFNFLSLITEEDKGRVLANFKRHLDGMELNPYEYSLVTKQGKILSAIINIKRIDFEGEKALLGIVTDITERRNAEEEVKKAYEKLKELDSAKRDFINIISHELKSPLTAIFAHLGVLESSKQNFTEQELNSWNAIMRNSKKLKNLINDILTISKIKAGKYELNFHDVDVNKAIHDTINDLNIIADKKNLRLIYNPKQMPSIQADPICVNHILTNLIGNAIKFTNKGDIRIDAKENNEYIEISISDSGEGIPPEKISTIFDKFTQVDSSERRRHEGGGLGLSIAKKLIELHNGTIGVKSEQGKGSVFYFSLPKIKE